MNEAMLDMFEKERENGFPFHHVHAVGKGGWETMETALRQRSWRCAPIWMCGSTSTTWPR